MAQKKAIGIQSCTKKRKLGWICFYLGSWFCRRYRQSSKHKFKSSVW